MIDKLQKAVTDYKNATHCMDGPGFPDGSKEMIRQSEILIY
jgi:hypothetical protein